MANPLSKIFNRDQYIKAPNYSLTTRALLNALREADDEDAGVKRLSVTDVFQQHDWANIAIHTIARNIARTEFKLYSPTDVEITEGEIFDLFNHVNLYMSASQLWEASSAWIQCRGEFLWMLDSKTISTMPTEIIVVDPVNWEHKLNKEKTEIVAWIYTDPDTGKKTPYKLEQMIHVKQWNKWDRWRGRNPLIAQRENVEQDYQANISNTSLIKNDSVPLGIISATQIVHKDQANQLIEQWETRHKGAKKAARMAILGHGAKYQQIGLKPAEMQYSDMRKWNRQSILARYGIPPAVVGVKDDAPALSGSDTAEQKKAFWNEKLIPEMKFIEDELETKFFKKFQLQIQGKFDYSTVPELQEDIHKAIDSACKLFAIGFTANELNEMFEFGFREEDWRNIPFRTSQVEEADPEDVEEAPPPPAFPTLPAPEPEEESAKVPSWIIDFEIESLAKWEQIIISYRSKLKSWFYEIRSWYLENFASLGLEERTAKVADVSQTYIEFLFWAEQELKLKTISEVFYYRAVEQAGFDLKVMFNRTGWDVSFDISTINAAKIVEDRLLNAMPQISKTINQSMADLIWRASKEGWTEGQLAMALRDRFADIGGKADTIARTELSIIKSDTKAQEMAKKAVEKIYWIHTGRSRVPRPHHVMMGARRETVIYGETFSNGLRWPHDVAGDISEIAGCTCDFGVVEKDANT